MVFTDSGFVIKNKGSGNVFGFNFIGFKTGIFRLCSSHRDEYVHTILFFYLIMYAFFI